MLKLSQYAYDPANGNLTTITAPDGGTISYAYDGSLLLSTAWTGVMTGSISRAYDADFRITSRSVNGANVINFGFDTDGLLASAGALTLTRNAQNGFLTGATLGVVSDNYTYSAFGEVAGYTANNAGSALFNVQYTRDALGRIAQKVETVGGVTTTYAYAYDTAGRLTSVSKNGAVVSSYTYDANGNRITATINGVTSQGFYDLQDRMTKYGAATYAYTANGELQTKTDATGATGTTSYSYDVFGNLMSVALPSGTLVEYVIDGNDRRIGKKINGVLTQGFLYKDSLNPIAELDGAGAIVSRFIYATKSNVPDFMIKGGVTYRIISDHLGSPRLVINTTTGAITQRLDYGEFGNITTDTNPGFQPFGFAGGIYDQHTKLTRFGARDYDATTGRWTSKDPIGFGAQDANLYGYVFNDPINWFDLVGLEMMVLPDGPSGLGPDWKRNYTHKDPHGERYVNKKTGDVLDFHKGREGVTGEKAKDHYHLNEGKKHFKPRDRVPLKPKAVPWWKKIPIPKFRGPWPFMINPCIIDPTLPWCPCDHGA